MLLLGYERTSVVRDKSEFAVRGSILDIYLIDHNQPIRLDFLDDVIETIHDFDWQLEDLEGTNINFNQSEGRVTLVNFWATWCPPCIAEMPSMQNLYNSYGDKVDFYFVSLEEAEILQKFIQKKGYKIPVYIPRSSLPEALAFSLARVGAMACIAPAGQARHGK
mgnify:CR=1 FL=1